MGDHNDDLYQSVGRVEGKLDYLIETIKQHIEDDKKVEVRIRSLEKWRAVMLAMGAVAGGAAGKISAFFGGS
jgi:hypothetical protein